MPEHLFILRIAVGIMCVVFAHFLGRALARKQKPRKRGLSTSSWALRTLLAAAAMAWPAQIDWIAAVVYALAAAAAALGFLIENRPKIEDDEDLTRQMFPQD